MPITEGGQGTGRGYAGGNCVCHLGPSRRRAGASETAAATEGDCSCSHALTLDVLGWGGSEELLTVIILARGQGNAPPASGIRKGLRGRSREIIRRRRGRVSFCLGL